MQNQPLRIALFTYSTKLRGSVVHTLELASALAKMGHSVSLYALDKDGSGFSRPVTGMAYLVPSQPVITDIDHLIRLRIQEFIDYLGQGHLQSHPYDCYHAQDCISANALAELRSQGLIPHLIRTVHHIEAFNSQYLRDCQDRSIQSADLCFCVSDYWQKELAHQYKIEAMRVINGVNSDRFMLKPDGSEATLKQTLHLTGSPIYLSVGGIEPRKNSLNLLRAFASILKVHPTAQWVIVGGATLFDYKSYREDFFALAQALGVVVGESLILPGVLSDTHLTMLYRIANAFVFPSLKEGWGLVILEAIAAGLPILTSNQPPFTEFLTDNQALMVDPHSPTAIAQAMLAISQPERARMLVRNSQPICEQYTWERSATMHVEHYYKLLERHH
ncbi:MAG TPA: MSMEG_0565 family glycosyltransferase [Stenomitos sp.]